MNSFKALNKASKSLISLLILLMTLQTAWGDCLQKNSSLRRQIMRTDLDLDAPRALLVTPGLMSMFMSVTVLNLSLTALVSGTATVAALGLTGGAACGIAVPPLVFVGHKAIQKKVYKDKLRAALENPYSMKKSLIKMHLEVSKENPDVTMGGLLQCLHEGNKTDLLCQKGNVFSWNHITDIMVDTCTKDKSSPIAHGPEVLPELKVEEAKIAQEIGDHSAQYHKAKSERNKDKKNKKQLLKAYDQWFENFSDLTTTLYY